jgi:hypothetical protein
MITKEKIINGINNLPDPITIDDILDEIILLEKIEKGLDQSEKDQIISDDDLDKRIDKWQV